MNQNLTDITLIIDRSGSMYSIQKDSEDGIKSFIEEQKAVEGECVVSLVQFDTEVDEVYTGKPIDIAPSYTLVPRGGTALFDAVAQTVVKTGERLSKMTESDRPGLVLILIVTDGGENGSKEYTSEQLKSLIKVQENDYNWKFTYLGANQDAFSTARSMGIISTSNYDVNKTPQTYNAISSSVTRARSLSSKGVNVSSLEYTSEEINSMTKG
jgi:hypothetical protein